MRDFKTLDIWKRGISLSKMIYVLSREFPAEEKFGLQSQIRRAATSIPINIAEGCGRDSLKDFAHFIHIAEGSASELECELIIAVELGFITDYQAFRIECSRRYEPRVPHRRLDDYQRPHQPLPRASIAWQKL